MATQIKRVLKASVSIVFNILKESQVDGDVCFFPSLYPTAGYSHVGIDISNKNKVQKNWLSFC